MTLAVTALPDENIIHLRGANIPGFLQGQLTCDLRALSPGRAVAGAMCNVKGRVLSDLWVVQVREEHSLLLLRQAVATAFAENLRRYAQFSRIDVSVDTRPLVVTGLLGEEAALDVACGGGIGSCASRRDFIFLRSGRTRAQALALPDAKDPADPPLEGPAAATVDRVPAADWYRRELREGHYAIDAQDWERFTPQALNYDLGDRVAFDKGCYTGQEVVARLHYKGEAKRRLATYSCAGNPSLAPGDALASPDGSVQGEVLRVLPKPEDAGLLVAAMVTAKRRGETLRAQDGTELRATSDPAL